MNERLLPSSDKRKTNQSRVSVYNPYKCPPDLNLAEYHHKATKIGIMPKDLSQELVVCPCCDNVINKQQFAILCNIEQFAYIGVGYTLFFVLYKYFALILLFIFVISGGAFFFLVSIECTQSCFKFFGIPIMSQQMVFSQSVKQMEVIHILTAVLILAVIVIVKNYISSDITRVQKKVLCPSQYTIMIQNVPKNLDVYDFKKWIHNNLKCTPILINIAYNTNQFVEAKLQRQSLEIEKNKLILKRRKMIKNLPVITNGNSLELTNTQVDQEIRLIQKKIHEQNKIVQGYYNNQIQLKEFGTVFVTFNTADEVEKILETHQKTFVNILVQKIAGIFYLRKLQYKGHQLVFYRAPAPREIIWENLQFSYIRNLFFEGCFVVGMVLFMLLTFRIQYWFVSRMYNLRHEGELTGNRQIVIQALMMSVVIMILNILLRVAVTFPQIQIQFLTKLRKSYSYTKQQSSFCTYYSMIFIINSCFTIYIVHGSSVQGSNRQLLIDIHTIMLTNAFSEPLFKIFDPIMWLKLIRQLKIQKMNSQDITYPQSYIHRLWEGHEISNADNYQYIIRVLFITVWFANIAPLGVLFSLFGMLLDYWIIKFLFIRVYKQPKNLSKKITKSLNFLEILPLVYIGGIMPFLYQITLTLDILTFFDLLFDYGMTTVGILLCILGYLYKFRPKSKYVSDRKYSEVELAFGFNYETENPFTKFNGEKKFLQQILKSEKSVQTEQMIKDILDESVPNRIGNNSSYVNKLKLTLSRKIQSRIQNNQPLEIQMKKLQSESQGLRQTFPMFLKNKNSQQQSSINDRRL